MRKLLRGRGKRAYRVFFATDVHGSDRCFRKFLTAARVYEADAIILGGDVGGKAIVPIAIERDRAMFVRHGVAQEVGREELEQAQTAINFSGDYPLICDAGERARIREDGEYRERLFEKIIESQLRDWCDLARDRLRDGVRCIITPGNDDPLGIDAVLGAQAPPIESPELGVIELGPVWLASLGNTNRTPWATPREYDEGELQKQIDGMLERFADGRPLVFNFHCPPHASGLDTAALLDDELRPMVRNGAVVSGPVGSTAVRGGIAKYHPIVGLHGHIHESKGSVRIGKSLCLNPGSDYVSGVLRGAIVDFAADGTYVEHLLTAG